MNYYDWSPLLSAGTTKPRKAKTQFRYQWLDRSGQKGLMSRDRVAFLLRAVRSRRNVYEYKPEGGLGPHHLQRIPGGYRITSLEILRIS